MKIRRPAIHLADVGKYLLFLCAMFALNFALPRREPLAFALYFPLCVCGGNPFLLSAAYLAASAAALSLTATLACALQAAFTLLLFVLYRRKRREMGWERLVFSAVLQLPFLFLYPHAGYALFSFSIPLQKALCSLFLWALTLLFEGGVRALLFRAFRSRLTAAELTQLSLIWFFLGLGLLGALGKPAFYFLSLALLFSAAVLVKNATAVPFAVVLSLPLCAETASVFPLAAFAVLACAALLFIPYGRIAAALSLSVVFLGVEYLEGLYAASPLAIALTLLACFLPTLVLCCIPNKALKKVGRSLLFYRERTLPRIAINRSRRAVGERLYEVSSLFREIETAFGERECADESDRLRAHILSSLCGQCTGYRTCIQKNLEANLGKLIAVGKAKGKVSLIDMPTEMTNFCCNAAGLLFALNRQLADFRRYSAEMETAREGRRLLAEQAHGVSEILRDIALEQSEEYVFTEEEGVLSAALTEAGLLSSEIFTYGEGKHYTVSLTLPSSADGKRLCSVAEKALKTPLALSEKIPLTASRACFILRRKPRFDAVFGIAARPKEGEIASGDTHSILKIDERRFLVALSDGMGSGEGARAVSDRTLTLLESFYKAKMPKETVLATVNKLIAFPGEESFSCLDLAAVDLDTGETEVVKIGSPMGFLLSGEELRVLEGESLPLGMLEAVHPACMQLTMKEDDFLIFMSDGVTSAFGSSAELCDYLSGLKPLNPQSLAEDVLRTALGRCGGVAEDDVTVLTVKLIKAA